MAPSRRRLRRIADVIDARRWQQVSSLMGSGEVPLHNTGGVLLADDGSPSLFGYLLLSDAALYAHFPLDADAQPPAPGQSLRMPLATIRHAVVSDADGPVVHVEWLDDDGELQGMSMKAHSSAFTADLYNDLIRRLRSFGA